LRILSQALKVKSGETVLSETGFRGLLWAPLAFGRRGRVSVFNETRQEDVHQGVGSTAIATGDDVRNEFEPARGESLRRLNYSVVVRRHGGNLQLDYVSLGRSNRQGLSGIGVSGDLGHRGIRFRIERLGLGLTFGLLNRS